MDVIPVVHHTGIRSLCGRAPAEFGFSAYPRLVTVPQVDFWVIIDGSQYGKEFFTQFLVLAVRPRLEALSALPRLSKNTRDTGAFPDLAFFPPFMAAQGVFQGIVSIKGFLVKKTVLHEGHAIGGAGKGSAPPFSKDVAAIRLTSKSAHPA